VCNTVKAAFHNIDILARILTRMYRRVGDDVGGVCVVECGLYSSSMNFMSARVVDESHDIRYSVSYLLALFCTHFKYRFCVTFICGLSLCCWMLMQRELCMMNGCFSDCADWRYRAAKR